MYWKAHGSSSRRRSRADNMAVYEDAIRKLYSANLHQRVKMGLRNIEKILLAWDSPFVLDGSENRGKKVVKVHVAGTNGKGSVCWKVAKALESSGYKTGLFVSPHISCFRERVQVNGAYITQRETVELLDELFELTRKENIPGTFFEMTTALALKHFENAGCDAVVLETGLGGRLDSTNIVQPDVCAITSIGLDHVKILGDTIEEIAREKGGIIKPKTPVVVGPQCPHDVFDEIAEERDASIFKVQGLSGLDFCKENEMVARKVFDVLVDEGHIANNNFLDSADYAKAMESLPPCRFAPIGGDPPTALLDVAHNPAAIKVLFERLESMENGGSPLVVVGFSADKDISTCCDEILRKIPLDRIFVVSAKHPRAMAGADLFSHFVEAYNRLPKDRIDPSELEAFVLRYSLAAGDSNPSSFSVSSGIQQAMADRERCEEEDVIVFCGSAYGMNEAMKQFGVPLPDEDSESVQEAWENRKVGMTGEDEERAKQVVGKRSKFKAVMEKYGWLALGLHSTVYAMSLAGFFCGIEMFGLDASTYMESYGVLKNLPPEAGTLAIAWAMNSAITGVPRTALTVVATPVVAQMYPSLTQKNDGGREI